MARFLIEMTEDAKADLAWLAVPDRKATIVGIREQLSYEPDVETRNRKPLRAEPPRCELRLGKLRVFYQINHDPLTVVVGAVGYKEHNVLYIRGQEVGL